MLLLIYTMSLLIVLLSIIVLVYAEEKGDIIFFTITGVANLLLMISTASKII